jgi:hypothetical protein
MIDFRLNYEDLSKRTKNATRHATVSEKFAQALAVVFSLIIVGSVLVFIGYPLLLMLIELTVYIGTWIGRQL